MTKKDVTDLFDTLKGNLSEKELLILTIDHEPVDVFTEEDNRLYTLSIEEIDGLHSIGSFRLDEPHDTSVIVYDQNVPAAEEIKAKGRVLKEPTSFEIVETDSKGAPSPIAYKYGEGETLDEIRRYIDSTYTKHYASEDENLQALDAVIATGHGLGFTVGNVLKYAWRLGKKDGFNLDDLMKVIHYAIIAIYIIKKQGKSK